MRGNAHYDEMVNLVIKPVWKRLSGTDRGFLLVMARDNGDSRIADIAARLRASSSCVGVYRSRLIQAGVICSSRRGRVRFTAEALLRGEQPDRPAPADRTLRGGLFESLIVLNLRVYAQAAQAAVHHMRKRAGEREIDFIVSARDGRFLALEAKLSGSLSGHDVRHLRWLQRELGEDVLDAAVITTGPQAYRRNGGIAVIPAALPVNRLITGDVVVIHPLTLA